MSTMKEAARPNVNQSIANFVSLHRARLGMTLDALAAKCKVSRSMLSLVERGESSPTAVVLEKIAVGLGVPLAKLFDDPSAPDDPVSRWKDQKSWKDPESNYVRRNVSPPNYPSPIRIVEVTLPARARVAYETGARETMIHQQVWVKEGHLELAVGPIKHQLAVGDCLAMLLDQPITFHNRTRKPVRYIVVIAPGAARAPRK
jgi:transcriptional regulator with XRE-family HTH domain